MAKQDDDEKAFEQYLENQYNAGYRDKISKMKLLEEFRSARAQRRAATYALYAALAAGVSTVIAIISLGVSVIALHSH
jgi:hypothetical protein